MEETLVKKSDFLKVKYKFFLNRILIYFSFLCIPLWISHTVGLNLIFQSSILLMYILFMAGQWYLLGKEVDHRLKIYYRANSSMERIVYRVVMGGVLTNILFSLVSLLPEHLIQIFFWAFFFVLGIFYSWPTRGKIIEETMTGQFGEIKFLDSFEKTVLVLSFLTFFISVPELSLFSNIEALKIYYDPLKIISPVFWGNLKVLYFPFARYPKLYNLIWNFHFYFIGLGLYLLTFYSLARYFFSRRLSMLGVFAILSTWSFSRILVDDFFTSISTTYTVIWVWSILWSTRSGTYRSGLLTGLTCAYMTVINGLNVIFLPLTLFFVYKFFLPGKTQWFKKQWLKYNFLGAFLSLLIFGINLKNINLEFWHGSDLISIVSDFIYRKAFFVISPIGLFLYLVYLSKKSGLFLTYANFNRDKALEILFGILSFIILGTLINPQLIKGFGLIWVLVYFCLIPIEWVFQSISRLRSKRNLIYGMYILVCLLDSHRESRFRIIGKMFLELESLKYFMQF